MSPMTHRPARKMPTMIAVARHLGILDRAPACCRCEWSIDGSSWKSGHGLERAHIIDRWANGLDTVTNLRPLCHECHRVQPIFHPGEESDALLWFSGISPFLRDLLILGLDGWDPADPDGLETAWILYAWCLGDLSEPARSMARENNLMQRHQRELTLTCRHVAFRMSPELTESWWSKLEAAWDIGRQEVAA